MQFKNKRQSKGIDDPELIWDAVISAPFGHLGIVTEMVDGSLMVAQICYLTQKTTLRKAQTELGKEVTNQCHQFFRDPNFVFDLPLKPVGTIFQQSVWGEISKIPQGFTKTYGDLAKVLRSAPRAVGQACGSNPYPLIVPCHRVVSASGIGGFAHQSGAGFHREIKTWLLKHEGAKF